MTTIAAVVVTYNRKALLLECLEALLAQTRPLDAIYVIDNASSDGTEAFLKQHGLMERICYERLEYNGGGALGFAYGLKKAYETGFEGYWIMDDDAEAALDALEKLIESPLPQGCSALACAVYRGTPQAHELQLIGHRGRFVMDDLFPVPTKPLHGSEYDAQEVRIDMASFVGLLIPHHSIKAIGFPEAKYFIHHDDTEYALRLGSIGTICMRTQSRIYHKELRTQERPIKRFLWMRKTRIDYEKLWIMYYSPRNTVDIALRYGTMTRMELLWRILKSAVMLSKAIILFDDHKFRRLRFGWSAYIDGWRGVFDNAKARRILYDEGTP